MLTLGMAIVGRAAESIDSVEKVAADWARIRAESIRLDTEWKSRRELLTSSLTALQEQVRFLEGKRDGLTAKSADERETAANLKAAGATAAKSMAAVTLRLDELRSRLLELRPWLPPRLSESLDLPYQSLADASIPPGDKVQLIVKVLNRCAQFNRTVTLVDEVMSPEGNTDSRMLEVIYWGLSHGYALDRVNGKVYHGQPAEKAWAWTPLAGQTEAVSQLIAMYKGKADPEFIDVSARVSAFPAAPNP